MSDYIFYKKDPHAFSNFWPAPIFLDGKRWPTSEHYFQAMKFSGTGDNSNPDYIEMIRKAITPGKAYSLGWAKKPREGWDDLRSHIMRKAVKAKFSQHSDLQEKLVKTGSRNIIQRCSRDKYWADGYPGEGVNMLGKILMEVRGSFKCTI